MHYLLLFFTLIFMPGLACADFIPGFDLPSEFSDSYIEQIAVLTEHAKSLKKLLSDNNESKGNISTIGVVFIPQDSFVNNINKETLERIKLLEYRLDMAMLEGVIASVKNIGLGSSATILPLFDYNLDFEKKHYSYDGLTRFYESHARDYEEALNDYCDKRYVDILVFAKFVDLASVEPGELARTVRVTVYYQDSNSIDLAFVDIPATYLKDKIYDLPTVSVEKFKSEVINLMRSILGVRLSQSWMS